MITQADKDYITQHFPQKAKKILAYLLDPDIIREAGIEPQEHEYFAQIPRHKDYYGSNYGRCISLKNGRITLLKPEGADWAKQNDAYVTYTLSKPRRKKKATGKKFGKQTRTSVSGQWIVGILFLPNYWGKENYEIHHINHCKWDNRWTNLILLPNRLHFYANRIYQILFFSKGKFHVYNPYKISRVSGLSLDEIYLALTEQPCKTVVHPNGRPVWVYDIKGYQLGYMLTEGAQERFDETGILN